MDHFDFAWIALAIAAARGFVVMDGLAFMALNKKRTIQWTRSMKITFAEPFLLLAASAYLGFYGPLAPMAEGAVIPLLALGVACSVFGLIVFIWSFVAYRNVGTGHYVDDDHEVVATGPYALIRHPMYCAAIFIWLGLALAYADWALLNLTFAYVIPTYYFYAREEETMMGDALGARYTDYAARTPMLFPKPLAIWE